MVSAFEVFTSDTDTYAVNHYELEPKEALDTVIDNRDSPRVLCNNEAASDKCCHNEYPPSCDCKFSIAGVVSVVVVGLKNFENRRKSSSIDLTFLPIFDIL